VGAIRRFLERLSESDESRLAAEVREWADRVPGSTRVGDASARERVRLAGVVTRITVLPTEGNESLEAILFDGTGEVTVVFMGRRTIPGLSLGTKLAVEGVLGEKLGRLRLVNPRFELLG
jgi:RecG-like helicase